VQRVVDVVGADHLRQAMAVEIGPQGSLRVHEDGSDAGAD